MMVYSKASGGLNPLGQNDSWSKDSLYEQNLLFKNLKVDSNQMFLYFNLSRYTTNYSQDINFQAYNNSFS